MADGLKIESSREQSTLTILHKLHSGQARNTQQAATKTPCYESRVDFSSAWMNVIRFPFPPISPGCDTSCYYLKIILFTLASSKRADLQFSAAWISLCGFQLSCLSVTFPVVTFPIKKINRQLLRPPSILNFHP